MDGMIDGFAYKIREYTEFPIITRTKITDIYIWRTLHRFPIFVIKL